MKHMDVLTANERLKASWNCFSYEHLSNYLRVEEEDQRINAQSILSRALMIDTLWPGKFDAFIHLEFQFGVVMTWLLRTLKSGVERQRILNGLQADDSSCHVPQMILEVYRWLQQEDCPLPDYITGALMHQDPDRPEWYLFEPALNTFSSVWRSVLSRMPANRIGVLEVACGSGNDYKAMRDCGLIEHVSYSGFDIAWKNIANAHAQFPEAHFFEASILNSELPRDAFDYVFLHDLIEHLAPDVMEMTLREIMRITKKEAWIHCFHAENIARHRIRPADAYYLNHLSISQIKTSLEEAGASVDVVSIPDLMEEKFCYHEEYAQSSVTFLAHKGRCSDKQRAF